MAKTITFSDTVTEDTLTLLVEQFKDLPNFKNFLTVFTNQMQELEDVSKQLYTLRNLDKSEGVQLDGLGEILGLSRNGLGDEEYRIALRFQALLNRSNGEPETLISALKIFTNSTIIFLFELFPAECYGYFNNHSFPIGGAATLNRLMGDLCLGGVKWLGSIIGNDRPFIFDKLYTIPDDSRLFGGFAAVDNSNVLIDDGTTGLFVAFL